MQHHGTVINLINQYAVLNAIIAMTANAMVRDREACLEAGMDDCIAKPFDAKDLTAKLDRWFRR